MFKLLNDYGYGKASGLVHWVDPNKSERHISLCDSFGVYPNLRAVSDSVEVTCPYCLKLIEQIK